MSMTREQVVRALAEKKALEISAVENCQRGGWISFELAKDARILADGPHNFGAFHWRLKATPVPPGDLTLEQAKEPQKQGVAVEWMDPDFGAWETQYSEVGSCSEDAGFAWRRKPTPRMVQLEAKDVPPGSAIRCGEHWQLVMECFKDGVYINRSGTTVRWDELRSHWEISRDGGKTWTKCEKEATC